MALTKTHKFSNEIRHLHNSKEETSRNIKTSRQSIVQTVCTTTKYRQPKRIDTDKHTSLERHVVQQEGDGGKGVESRLTSTSLEIRICGLCFNKTLQSL